MINKSKNYILANKIKVIAILVVLIGASYYGYTKLYSKEGESKYNIGIVKKGVLISTISGTGQVSPVSQIDLKPKASGDIKMLNAIAGSSVEAGTIIARLDTKDVYADVRDASASLESAKISYDKYKSQNSDEKLNANLVKSYDDGYTVVSSALLDIPEILNNLEDLAAKESMSQNTARVTGGASALAYYDKSESKFYQAQTSVNNLVRSSKGIERLSSNETIDKSLEDTYLVTKSLSDAIKAKKDFVDYLYEESGRSSVYSSIQTTLGQYSSTINSHMSAVSNSISSIEDSKDAFNDTLLGDKSSNLSVVEKQNSLRDAQDKLEDYIVRAPFAGIIAQSDAKVGDSASQSTIIATLITKSKMAEISLSEVDVAKVKLGQKATLTFDAITELTLTGEVSEIDQVGTESQGVVTYNVKITFDTQDERVKPGMSVSSSIIVNSKSDVLIVPNSAIKTQNGSQYVEVVSSQEIIETASSSLKNMSLVFPIEKKNVEVGDSNDEYTEIVSGLLGGDKIITRTITSTAATTKTTTTGAKSGSSVRLPGMGGGM